MISKYAKRAERVVTKLLLGLAASGRSHWMVALVIVLMLVTLSIEIYEDWNDDSPQAPV